MKTKKELKEEVRKQDGKVELNDDELNEVAGGQILQRAISTCEMPGLATEPRQVTSQILVTPRVAEIKVETSFNQIVTSASAPIEDFAEKDPD